MFVQVAAVQAEDVVVEATDRVVNGLVADEDHVAHVRARDGPDAEVAVAFTPGPPASEPV